MFLLPAADGRVLHRARGLLRLNQADLAVFPALPLYAQYSVNVDIRGRLFSAMNGHGPIDHLVGSCKQHRPYREAKRLCSLEIAGPERFENGPARCARHSG